MRSSLHPDHAGDAALVARVQAMALRLGAEAFHQQSLLTRGGDIERLDEIHSPTLILAGSHDRLRSIAEAEELHRGIKGSRLIVIEGVGHMIPMEAPQAFVAAIKDWLAAVMPPHC